MPEGGALPSTHWEHAETIANPLGVVPVVDLTNSGRLLDANGTPEARDIWTLVDALAKLRPTCWSPARPPPCRAAGPPAWWSRKTRKPGQSVLLEPGIVWQSEDPATAFGSFPSPHLAGYDTLITMIIRQIGAISGLPDFLVGIAGVDPFSAEQIRASEPPW